MRPRVVMVFGAALAGVPIEHADAAPSVAIARAYEGPTSVGEPPPPPLVTTDPIDSAPPPRPRAATPTRLPRAQAAIEPRTAIRVRPVLDLTITLGTAAPSLALALWIDPALPDRVPAQGDTSRIAKLDRIALDRFERAPAIASDVLLAATIAAPFIYHAIEAGVRRRGWSTVRGRGFLVRYGTDVLLLAESLAINALLTEVLKAAIRRPRPYTHIDPADADPSVREELIQAQLANDADRSFPSGHTSVAFTAATAGATLLTLELLGRSRWAIALAWTGGLAMASTTAALRVASGRHFTSDVLTSALIGFGIGAAVPLAHWRPVPSGDRAHVRPRRRWTLMPARGRGYTGAVFQVPL